MHYFRIYNCLINTYWKYGIFVIIKPDYVNQISSVMHQEYLAEKFLSNYVVSLMLVPTHENVPGNVFKWQKMSERQTNAGNLQNLTLSRC